MTLLPTFPARSPTTSADMTAAAGAQGELAALDRQIAEVETEIRQAGYDPATLDQSVTELNQQVTDGLTEFNRLVQEARQGAPQ